MVSKKGFTLIELIIVMIIVGIIVKIAIPSILDSMWQTKTQAVEHKLMAILAAEQKFYEDHGVYSTTPYDGNDYSGELSQHLSLSMANQNDGFNYECFNIGAGTSVQCTGFSTTAPSSQISVINEYVNGDMSCFNQSGQASTTCP